MLIPSNLYKYSIIFLIFLWTTVSFAEGFDTNIWCELQTTDECGECSIIAEQELDQKVGCAFGKITPVPDDETTTNPPPVVVSPADPPLVVTPEPTTVTPPDVPETVETPTTTPDATNPPVNLSPVAEKPVTEVTATGHETAPPSTNSEKPNTSTTKPSANATEVTASPPQTVATEQQPQKNDSSLPNHESEKPSPNEPQQSEESSEIIVKPTILQFTQKAVTIDEFGHSSTVLTVLVERTVNCQESVSVEYEIRPETATFPEDYQVSTGQVLTWPKGDCDSKAIKIAVKDDTEVEQDETFSIALLPPSKMAELGTPRILRVTIRDDDKISEQPLCDMTRSLQPAQYDLLLHLDDAPITLSFANAQSPPEIKQVPDPQVVTLELPIIYENKAAQLKIVPYGIGETTLVIGDCASQATVHITVEAIPIISCVSDNALALTLDTPTITFLEEDRPMTLTVTRGQGQPRLIKAPNGEIVTLQSLTFPDYAAAQIVLSPRKAGETQLKLADCASEVDLTIRVLKTGTLAYYCWLDGKTTEICEKPDTQQISPNSRGIDAQGKGFTPLTHFTGKISINLAEESENLIISLNKANIKAEWITFVDPGHQNQKADLLVVAEQQTPEGLMEWWMFDGRTWQTWDGEDLATLIEMARESLPAILEKTVELGNLLSENGSFGEFTLYFGYRLDNGSLIFNGVKPLYFSF